MKHPNVVRAYGAELIDNEVGLSMELVKGHTLDEIVKRQEPFSANEAAVIGIDLCRALAAVHRADILHGDIKAHNVMRENGGRTVLMDFGTGRDSEATSARPPPTISPALRCTSPPKCSPGTHARRRPRSTVLECSSISSSPGLIPSTVIHALKSNSSTSARIVVDRCETFGRICRTTLFESWNGHAENPRQRYHTAGELEAALADALAPSPIPHPTPIPIPLPLPVPSCDWKKPLAIAAAVVLAVGLA